MDNNFLKYANSNQTIIKLGLDKINLLLKYLGNPHKDMKYIHIAGTNGKGSVSAFISEALIKKGFTTGKYISPNMIKVNERVSVNNIDISDSDMENILKEIEAQVPKVEKELNDKVSQYEIWTAMGFIYFKRKKCDIVVLETGLGGRFDATNVIENNIMSIITKIDLDHTQYLGDTKEKIAFEKCGIIKENSVVITTSQNKDVMGVIEENAKKKNNRLIVTEDFTSKGFEKIFEIFDYKDIKDIKLSLGGYHQIVNALISIEALKQMDIDNDTIKYGLSHAKNMGRFELLRDNPDVIFDGSHNPDGISALKKSLDRYFKDSKKAYVMASMSDKEIGKSFEILNDGECEFLFVAVKDNERSRTPLQMKEEADKYGVSSKCFDSVKEAVNSVKDKNTLVVICGSLYLYSQVEL